MQPVFRTRRYIPRMPRTKTDTSHLRKLREKAGISLRELARQIGEQPSNITFWETSGTLPRSSVLIVMAQAIGCSVEEILGEDRPQRIVTPGGKLGRIFEEVSQLPRRQQERIIEVVDDMLVARQAKQLSVNGEQQ